MENPENNFSPQQSLQLIESMINRAKDKFAEDGSMYLIWGWLVFICSLLPVFIVACVSISISLYSLACNHSCFYLSIFLFKKKQKQQNVVTYTDYIIGFVWITFCHCNYFAWISYWRSYNR